MPDGTFARFAISDSPIMEAELAAKFPGIKTYSGQGIDDPTATIRFDVTPSGFHAMVIAAGGTTYIDPFSRGDVSHYISYDKRDYKRTGEIPRCLLDDSAEPIPTRDRSRRTPRGYSPPRSLWERRFEPTASRWPRTSSTRRSTEAPSRPVWRPS